MAGGATALRDLEHSTRDAARALPHLLAEAPQTAREKLRQTPSASSEASVG